jgi:hypothetical protein
MKNLALSLKLSIASNRISQIEHTSNKSVHGFMLNMIGGLIAYPLKTITLQLNITNAEFGALFFMALTDLMLIACLLYTQVKQPNTTYLF